VNENGDCSSVSKAEKQSFSMMPKSKSIAWTREEINQAWKNDT